MLSARIENRLPRVGLVGRARRWETLRASILATSIMLDLVLSSGWALAAAPVPLWVERYTGFS